MKDACEQLMPSSLDPLDSEGDHKALGLTDRLIQVLKAQPLNTFKALEIKVLPRLITQERN
jgi:hypothetical protein